MFRPNRSPPQRPSFDLTRSLAPAQVDGNVAPTAGSAQSNAGDIKRAPCQATIPAPATAVVHTSLLTGAEMRRRFEEVFFLKSITEADAWAGENGRTVQLAMLFDQIPVPFANLSDNAQKELCFHTPRGSVDPSRRLRLCDLSAVIAFRPHYLTKRVMPNSERYAAWSSFSPPADGAAHERDEGVYVSLGQFPDALSAEELYWIFRLGTGVRPLAVDRLKTKGSCKVFLRSADEKEHVLRWSQTMQVTEFGTLFTAAPDSRACECVAARQQLLLMRSEVNDHVKRLAARREPYNELHPVAQKRLNEEYDKPFRDHAAANEKLKAATTAAARETAEAAVRITKAALEKAQKHSPNKEVIRQKAGDRNGLNPMTISPPAEPKRARSGPCDVATQPRRQQPSVQGR